MSIMMLILYVFQCKIFYMCAFQDMLKKISSSTYYDQMVRFSLPLYDHFGINHFWYYKISNSGHYSYVGTHAAWNEFSFENPIVKYSPCLRHPDSMQKGISFMKTAAGGDYKELLNMAWEKFKINLNINLVDATPSGIEAFGFASSFNDLHADERLLNHLPLLRTFTGFFKKRCEKLIHLLDDNQVDLRVQFGQQFYERPSFLNIPFERDKFLRQIGFENILSLTPRESEILKFMSNGYSAPYIATQLHLSKRTVENYLETIKSKLFCNSKTELIQKAHRIAATGYFN